MTPEIMKMLASIAEKYLPSDQDDARVMDYCGTSIDDAYHFGLLAGEKSLAKKIIALSKEEAKP